VDEHASKAGLRAVAVFEAGKGILVLALAAALVAVRDHIEDLAEDLLYHLHIGFDHRLAQAMSYATVRFVEAWGLWHRRVWAEWFALLSGALYLPFEILKVAEHRGWETIAVLVINLVIVFYMLEIRIREARSRENGVTSNSP
jgi:uncharacterized membrane protein (DUF2068 family)